MSVASRAILSNFSEEHAVHSKPPTITFGIDVCTFFPTTYLEIALYRDVKLRGIYPALFTDPEGDSCFSIYQISWKKKKKVLFVN